MAQLIVGISDMKFSGSAQDVIVTHSLGSCVGLTAYDPVRKVGALIHCLLPHSKNNAERAKKNPYMFVSSGVTDMLRMMLRKGSRKDDIVLKAAGGAQMMNVANIFDTGKRNYETLEALLRKNGMRLAAKDVGGHVPRTMYFHLENGKVIVKSRGVEREL